MKFILLCALLLLSLYLTAFKFVLLLLINNNKMVKKMFVQPVTLF